MVVRRSLLNAALTLFERVMSKKVFIWSIIAGLIASILLSYVLEPLSIWVWEMLTGSASNWANELQTSAIMNAAMGTRPWVSAIGFMLMITIASSFLFITTVAVSFKYYLRSDRTINKKKSNPPPKKVMLSLCGLAILNTLFLMYIAFRLSFTVYVDLQMNASFSQRMNAIKPYISQHDYDLLRSNWALMSSRKDYENINEKLSAFGNDAGINLPKVMYE